MYLYCYKKWFSKHRFLPHQHLIIYRQHFIPTIIDK